jgi:hypothetical protein
MLACTGISLYVLYVLTFVLYLMNCDAKCDRVYDVRRGRGRRGSEEWSGRRVQFGSEKCASQLRPSDTFCYGDGIRKNIALIPYSPRGLILHERVVFRIEFTVNPLPAVETRPYPTWRARSA